MTEKDIIAAIDQRKLDKGWKRCKMAVNCWIMLGTETPAEHVDEHHPRSRKLIKQQLDQNYADADEDVWVANNAQYEGGSRYARRTPLERSNFVDPQLDDAERSLTRQYSEWRRATKS